MWQVLVDPTVTHLTVKAGVGVAIVTKTISRWLVEAHLISKCPFRELPLTPEHRRFHLQWFQARAMWNATDWQKLFFSNEFRFVLSIDAGVCLEGKLSLFSDISQNSTLEKRTFRKI